jgi:hypothetical protein
MNIKVFYSGISVLTFLYICFVSGLYTEFMLLDFFSVPAGAEQVFETKTRLSISHDTPLTDEEVTRLLSVKVTQQRNWAIFAIFCGTCFSLTALTALTVLLNKLIKFKK